MRVLSLILLCACLRCSAGEHIITDYRPIAVDSPLEFKTIARGRKTLFTLAYKPDSERGELTSLKIVIKADKCRGQSLKDWIESPSERVIAIFRRTWKNPDQDISEAITTTGDEVERMVACAYCQKDGVDHFYYYPLVEVFRSEANQSPQHNADGRPASMNSPVAETLSSPSGPRG